MEHSAKVLVVGLDGATFRVLDGMIEKGIMHNLGDLVKEGFSSVLQASRPLNSAACWTTITTGCSPAKHGIFGFTTNSFQEGRFKSHIVNATDVRTPRVWDILSTKNKKVLVVNVPVTYPVQSVNGILISDFLTPPGATDFVYPPDLRKDIEGYKIDTRLGESYASIVLHQRIDYDKFLEEQIEVERLRGKFVYDLTKKLKPDFGIVVFNGVDTIQHLLWHLTLPTRPKYENTSSTIRNKILDYFSLIDESIGRLRSLYDTERDYIFIISDHGFKESSRNLVDLSAKFADMGLGGDCTFQQKVIAQLSRTVIGTKFSDIMFYFPYVEVLARILGRQLRENRGNPRKLPFATMFTEDSIKIFANSEEERIRIRRLMINVLSSLRDRKSETKIVGNVVPLDELYQGPYLSEGPDLIVMMEEGYRTTMTPLCSLITKVRRINLTGEHDDEGIFIGTGKDIKKGHKAVTPLQQADLTPTFLNLLGCPAPSYIDGKLLSKIFIEPKLPITSNVELDQAKRSFTFDAREEEEIKRRLSALGYI